VSHIVVFVTLSYCDGEKERRCKGDGWGEAAFLMRVGDRAGDSWLEGLQSPSFPLSLPLVANH
jgi:hypothetical protein